MDDTYVFDEDLIEELTANEGKICDKGISYVLRTDKGNKGKDIHRGSDGKIKNWSARAAQIASKKCKDPSYGTKSEEMLEAEGGLKAWQDEEWVHSDGRPCGGGKKDGSKSRCKPKAKWKSMSASEKKADNSKKRAGGKKGKQYVPATKKGKVTKKYTKREGIDNARLSQIIREEYNKVKSERQEIIEYHTKNKTSFVENVYRVGSDKYFVAVREGRKLYNSGKLANISEEDKEVYENTELGEWAMFEGERVPLDFPMYSEDKKLDEKKKDPPIGKPSKNSGSGKKYKVFVRNPKTGNVKKITYGDSKGGLKGNWNNSEARASFAARHKCASKKDRTSPGYWACRAHKDFGTNVPGRFW